MKNVVLLAIALVAIGNNADAQEQAANAQPAVRFGFKAGLNLANYGADAEGTSARSGLHIGAVGEFPLSESFSVQPELLYSMQGAKADAESLNGLSEATDKLDYLLLPVMLKFYPAEGFSIEAGPQFGILLSANTEGEMNGENVEADVKEQFNTFDMALNGGLGYELPFGLFFQARYSLGVSNIIAPDSTIDGVVVTNNVLQFSAGYKF